MTKTFLLAWSKLRTRKVETITEAQERAILRKYMCGVLHTAQYHRRAHTLQNFFLARFDGIMIALQKSNLLTPFIFDKSISPRISYPKILIYHHNSFQYFNEISYSITYALQTSDCCRNTFDFSSLTTQRIQLLGSESLLSSITDSITLFDARTLHGIILLHHIQVSQIYDSRPLFYQTMR